MPVWNAAQLASTQRERVRILLFCQLNPPWLVDEGEEGPNTASVKSLIYLLKANSRSFKKVSKKIENPILSSIFSM